MLRRFSVFFLAFLLCLSLFPARALADVGNASVLWSGSINDGTQFGAFVKGGTRYDAAAASLGYDSSRFSDEVKAKLTDPHYGGMFYTFANAFSSVSSPVEIPSWVPAFVTTSSVIADLWNNISGSNYPHWSVAVTYSVYDLALRDLLVVLNGGGSGGGSGGGGGTITLADYYPVSSFSWADDYSEPSSIYDITAQNATFSNGELTIGTGNTVCSPYVNSPNFVSNARFYLSPNVVNFVNQHINAGFKVSISESKFIASSDLYVYYGKHPFDTMEENLRYLRSGTRYITLYSMNISPVYYDGELFIFCNSVTGNARNEGNGYYTPRYFTDVFDSPIVLPPSGTWPEPDVPAAPVAPELPEPADPVVETPVSPTVPAPVWPDITINIDNDPIPGTTPSGLDYTELLTRINDNLISIDAFVRAINSNLNSLRADLLAEFNGVIDSLRNVYNYLLTIDSVLETHCTHLRNKIEQSAVFIANYMRTLIKWLADQLDFDDLTNVEAPDNSLLTTINEKLGGGTYEPNPIKDEQVYYEWLDDLWDRFLLGDNWQSSMGSISGSFSELKTRFPFSVPWDIVALFRLFVHDPVTPVFDLPLYFSADGSTPVHVDLSPWDSVASLVRPMVFVIFALKLALLSRDLLGGLGADKGGL